MGRSPLSRSKRVRDIAPPIQRKFCRLAKEFNEERGLSLLGVDPRTLRGKNDITAKDWSDVFFCPKPGSAQGTGAAGRVKCYNARMEYVERLIHRHWDVYQQEPNNYEIGHLFAKAFALENCTAAREASTPEEKERYTIAWAHFAEEVMQNAEAKQNISAKRRKWEEIHDLKTPTSYKTDVGMSGTHVGTTYMKAPYSTEELQIIENMGFLANQALLATKEAVEKVHQDVDDACRDLHRAEGTLEGSSSVRLFLEGQIKCMKSEEERRPLLKMLEELRPTVDIDDLRTKVDISKAQLAMLEKGIKRSESTLLFAKGLISDVSTCGRYMFGYAPPPIVENDPDDAIKVGQFAGGCTGCGLLFSKTALDVFSLPCGHVYHMLCLAYMGKAIGQCVEQGCMQVLPERVRLILGMSPPTVKVVENCNEKTTTSFMGHAQSSVAGLGEQEKVWPSVERDADEQVEGTTPPCSRNAEPDSKNTTTRSSSLKSPSRKSTSSKSAAPSSQKTSPPKTSGQRITRSSPVVAQSNIGTSKSPSRKSTSLKSPAPSPQKTSPPTTSGQRITRSSPVVAQSNIGTATSPMKTGVEDEDLLLMHYAKAKTSRAKQKLNLSGWATRSTH